MKIRKADGTTVNRHGQLVDAREASSAPTDIPSIIEDYVTLVGRTLHHIAQIPAANLKPNDVRNIIALGKGITTLQAIEVAKLATVGGRSLSTYTTAELEAFTGEDIPVEAEFSEESEDE